MRLEPAALEIPVVSAPMAGGPSTPALAAAVSEAGGLGFLAAGYKTPEAVLADIGAVREATRRPLGVNLFVPSDETAAAEPVTAYAAALQSEAEHYAVSLGRPRHDDDSYAAKLELVIGERIPVISFTFGCPSAEIIARLKSVGIAVWITVTGPAEARLATDAGADALIAQGTEAGGHRAFFRDDGAREELGLLVLLRLLRQRCEVPLIAAGGIMDGPSIAAVLCAGAAAAQLGTALMRTPEAGTFAAHRERLITPSPTRLTRAFSGRTARGLVNRFMDAHDDEAPVAYPEVHHLTSPLRAAARERGDAEAVNLWAGQGHVLARDQPAGELVKLLADRAAETLGDLARRAAPRSG